MVSRLSWQRVTCWHAPTHNGVHPLTDLPSYVVKMQPESLSQQHVADASEGVVMSQTTLPERLASVSARRRNFHQRYAKGTSLGKGAFAEVFEAVKRSTGEVVAVKILDKRRLRFSSSGSATDIIQEAHMLAGMTHPCFLRLRDVLESKDFLFLITDKADGGELFERLYSKGAYTESRARIILWRLAAAISHMHARGVVHRDLKPENVLLLDKSDDTSVVIADFGVAKAVGAEGLQSYCGTPQYLAPEVLVAQMPGATAGYGKPADMWSVGVITYILLCGSPPFHPEALKAQKHKVQWGFPARQWAAISQEAKDLITGLLAPQPEDRLTVQQLLKHPWLEEVRDLPELAALLESPTEAPPDAPSPVDDGVAAAAGSGGEAPPLMFRQGTAGGMHDDDFDPTVSAQVSRSPAPFAAAASLGGSKRTRSDPDSPSAKKPRT